MKLLLVGGAVRDKLLGKTPKDLDYIAIDCTEEDLLKAGYKRISSDFPVFQRAKENDIQVSLPRKDYKTGTGYTGFTVSTENVTLEEDLLRRDFTINAMAFDEKSNTVIDPFNGKKDLSDKIIRHVGEHFSEDPLRMLRAARFAARLNFVIHDSTKLLIKKMLDQGMLNEIKKDRFYLEFKKSIIEGYGSQFIFHLNELKIELLPSLVVDSILLEKLKNVKEVNSFFTVLLEDVDSGLLTSSEYSYIPVGILNNILFYKQVKSDLIKYSTLSTEEKYDLIKKIGKNRKNLFFVLKLLKILGHKENLKSLIKNWKIFRYSKFTVPSELKNAEIGLFYKNEIIKKLV